MRGAPRPRHRSHACSQQLQALLAAPKLAQTHPHHSTGSTAAAAAHHSSKLTSVVDIDANNAGNFLACAEYARDIFDHLHEVEVSPQTLTRCGWELHLP